MDEVPLTGRRALDAVANAPANLVAEVIDGVLYTSPRPRIRHARATSMLATEIGWRFDHDGDGGPGRPGGWILLVEPEFHFGDGPDIVVPDMCGWRRDRLPELPDRAYMELAPDWACEVISPSTEHIDRGKKRAIYAREHIRHLWFVAPEAKLVEVFVLEGEGYRLVDTWGGAQTTELPPFARCALPLGKLWID